MTKRRLFTITLALMAATAPWPFSGDSGSLVWGLPPWTVYVVGMTVVYAAAIAFFLGRYWHVSAAGSEDERAEPRR